MEILVFAVTSLGTALAVMVLRRVNQLETLLALVDLPRAASGLPSTEWVDATDPTKTLSSQVGKVARGILFVSATCKACARIVDEMRQNEDVGEPLTALLMVGPQASNTLAVRGVLGVAKDPAATSMAYGINAFPTLVLLRDGVPHAVLNPTSFGEIVSSIAAPDGQRALGAHPSFAS